MLLIGNFHGGVARDVVVEVAGLEVVGVGGDGGQEEHQKQEEGFVFHNRI